MGKHFAEDVEYCNAARVRALGIKAYTYTPYPNQPGAAAGACLLGTRRQERVQSRSICISYASYQLCPLYIGKMQTR